MAAPIWATSDRECMVQFEVTIEGVEELDRAWRGTFLPRLAFGATQAVHAAVQAGVAVAKARVPVSANPRGTHLRDEITGGIVLGAGGEGGWTVVGEFVAGKPYAKFVEGGTRPHVIKPNRAHVLAWENPAQPRDWHFALEVHHPGTQAHPFMGPAYFAAEQRLEAELEVAVASAAAAFEG